MGFYDFEQYERLLTVARRRGSDVELMVLLAGDAGLRLGEILGQGASGVIYQGLWTTKLAQQEVAIKIFKGEITSDGLPTDEMAATLAAGCHAINLHLFILGINQPTQAQPTCEILLHLIL